MRAVPDMSNIGETGTLNTDRIDECNMYCKVAAFSMITTTMPIT